MTVVRTPHLDSLFPHRANPCAAAAEDHVRIWARVSGLVTGADARHLDRWRLGTLAANLYPEATPADLELVADWSAWFLTFDDRFEAGAWGERPATLRAAVQDLQVALRRDPPPTSPFATALRDLWTRTTPRMGPAWRRRFATHLGHYLDSCVWEMAYRTTGRMPDIATYLEKRRSTGGIRPMLDLIEMVDGELPEATHRAPTFRRLATASVDILCWANDVFSREKEYQAGDTHNLTLLLWKMYGSTLENVVEQVRARISDEVDGFAAARRELEQTCSDARKVADSITYFMGGRLHWMARTSRYQHTPP